MYYIGKFVVLFQSPIYKRMDLGISVTLVYCYSIFEVSLRPSFFCRAVAANSLKRKFCKHFAGWTLKTFNSIFLRGWGCKILLQGEHCKHFEVGLYFWVEAAKILQGGCCKHFKIRYIFLGGWGSRLDALNILQGERCKYFTAWTLQTCNNNILALSFQQYCHIQKAG